MLKTVDDLESHVANLEALFETYDGASAVPLDEDRKIERVSAFGRVVHKELPRICVRTPDDYHHPVEL
jgi:hypothetical protein